VHPSPVLPSSHGPGFGNWRRRLLGSASIFTLIMIIPQVLNIWVGRRAAGVSLFSWSAYLASALLWLWHGIRQRDRNLFTLYRLDRLRQRRHFGRHYLRVNC
jgi:hypothetical protein